MLQQATPNPINFEATFSVFNAMNDCYEPVMQATEISWDNNRNNSCKRCCLESRIKTKEEKIEESVAWANGAKGKYNKQGRAYLI